MLFGDDELEFIAEALEHYRSYLASGHALSQVEERMFDKLLDAIDLWVNR